MNTYAEKLKDPRWQKKRLHVMERDGFTCQDCGATHKTLQVHHCHYSKGEPWDTRDDLLLTLCEECHEDRQALENDAKLMLARIFASTSNAGHEESEHPYSKVDTPLRAFVASLATLVSSKSEEPLAVDGSALSTLLMSVDVDTLDVYMAMPEGGDKDRVNALRSKFIRLGNDL